MSKNKSASGYAWSLIERFMSQGVTLVVSIILARLLDPSAYGTVSIVTIFTTLGITFVTAGFGAALVQMKDPQNEDYDTAFTLNLSISIVLYALLYFTAPFIALFYETPELTKVLRIMSLILPISAFSTIKYAYLQKKLQFKKYALVTLCAGIFSGVLGIAMAFCGFGVYALVAQSLSKYFIDMVVLFIVCPMRTRIGFSFNRCKKMFPFASKVFLSTLVMNIESDIRGLVIGKKYTSSNLAYYNKANNFPKMIVMNTNGAVSRVLFPTVANNQNDLKKVLEFIRKNVAMQSFLITPLVTGLMAVSKPFILTLLTETWAPAIPFMYLLCLVYIMMPYENTCKEALLGIGRSDLVFMDMLITKTVSLATIVAAVLLTNSVHLIAVGGIVASFVSLVIYSVQMKKYFGYSIASQIKDTGGAYLCCAIMGFSTFSLNFLGLAPLVTLVIQIVFGVSVYCGLAKLLRLKAFDDTVKMIFKRRNSNV